MSDGFCTIFSRKKYGDFINNFLVGGLEHFLFSHILGIVIPVD